jgi:Homeodomain-like domain
MRKGITVEVSAADRARLEAVAADRNSPQKHVWRARIILGTAEGSGTNAIVRRAGVSKPCVWRWQERFAAEGVDGLLRDKTRPPGTPPLPEATVERVVELTREPPPGEATHWTGRAMAGGFTEVMVGLAEGHGRPRGGDHVRASRGLPGLWRDHADQVRPRLRPAALVL